LNETYNKVCAGTHVFAVFTFQNGLKKDDASSVLLTVLPQNALGNSEKIRRDLKMK
jgi:hypothetical protein